MSCFSSVIGAGLSPRARGNQPGITALAVAPGTIPACAGEPWWPPRSEAWPGDYPRVRGGTSHGLRSIWSLAGLSPRARGNRGAGALGLRLLGTIPACAGEPACLAVIGASVRDYPRVRGGTWYSAACSVAARGLSPRARGNPARVAALGVRMGTIPACAGEPVARMSDMVNSGDYPRVRGGTSSEDVRHSELRGLSPRARGNRQRRIVARQCWRTIPACAGEPLS